MTLPMVVPDAELPKRVLIYEVGPRDGLQNDAVVLEPTVRSQLTERLAATGVARVGSITGLTVIRWLTSQPRSWSMPIGSREVTRRAP